MNIKPHEITTALLHEECGQGSCTRGRRYFDEGRVIQVMAAEQGEDLLLSGRTRGSGGRLYEQNVELIRLPAGLAIDGFCDCPVSFNCKHVVAVCLTFHHSAPAAATGVEDGPAAFIDWLRQIQTGGREPAGTVDNRSEHLLYLLKRGGDGEVSADFSIARLKRDGRLGKGRRTTLTSLDGPYYSSRLLQKIDEEIVSLLTASNPYSWEGTTFHGAAGHLALTLMVDSGRAFWGEQRERPLSRGPALQAGLKWKEEGGLMRLAVGLPEPVSLVGSTPPLYVDPERNEVGELLLPAGFDGEGLAAIASAPAIPQGEADRLSRLLALHHPALPTPVPVEITEIDRQAPVPLLTLRIDGDDPLASLADLRFLYGEFSLDPATAGATVTEERDGRLLRLHRDIAAEEALAARLPEEGLEADPARPGRFTVPGHAAPRQTALGGWFGFLDEGVPRLEAEGWQVAVAPGASLGLSHADDLGAEVEEAGNDWFGLRFDIEIDGQRHPLLPLVSELIGDYRPGSLPPTVYLPYGAGRHVAVASERIEPILQHIIELYGRQETGDELRLSRLDAPRLLELGDIEIRGAKTLRHLAQKLKDFSGIKTVQTPPTFKGELRGYQQQGLNWLQFLREYGLAGILADDMGLGKTVQTLAHLAVEKRGGRMKNPSLIVAPTSLMGNWRREAEQFTPGLKVLVLHGAGRHEHFTSLGAYDLILTTYPLLPRDREVLLAQPFHYLILDEAQQVKNPRAQAAQLVRALHAEHRLCLTGTPMENHLGELWAQFDFLLPGFLGDQKRFTRNYRTPIEKQGDHERLQLLQRRVAPFMLRRTKEAVAAELPPKSELLRSVPLDGRQAALYESIRLTMDKKVREAIAMRGLARSHITILDALLKLRQVCCDPRLLPTQAASRKGVRSAKLEMLMELVPELLAEGRRILLFSQFTSMLALIEEELRAAKIDYTKLTGQTKRRDEVIDAFRRGEADLFLISLKAGGVGLNLIEADTVIHYDPWWNPAVERQATDRAHRIGQENPVFVYKLITEGTVEEKILALQERKEQLAGNLYGNGKGKGGGDDLPLDANTISELLAACRTEE